MAPKQERVDVDNDLLGGRVVGGVDRQPGKRIGVDDRSGDGIVTEAAVVAVARGQIALARAVDNNVIRPGC